MNCKNPYTASERLAGPPEDKRKARVEPIEFSLFVKNAGKSNLKPLQKDHANSVHTWRMRLLYA